METVITAGAATERLASRILRVACGLTWPQFLLLKTAAAGEVDTLGALADQMGCSRGNITGIMDLLERDGAIMRQRSQDDRRVIHIRITEQGLEQLARAQQALASKGMPVAPGQAAWLSDWVTQMAKLYNQHEA